MCVCVVCVCVCVLNLYFLALTAVNTLYHCMRWRQAVEKSKSNARQQNNGKQQQQQYTIYTPYTHQDNNKTSFHFYSLVFSSILFCFSLFLLSLFFWVTQVAPVSAAAAALGRHSLPNGNSIAIAADVAAAVAASASAVSAAVAIMINCISQKIAIATWTAFGSSAFGQMQARARER